MAYGEGERKEEKQGGSRDLEPCVSPAFAITYFCNHCNIRFEKTSEYVDTLTLFFQKLEPKVIDP